MYPWPPVPSETNSYITSESRSPTFPGDTVYHTYERDSFLGKTFSALSGDEPVCWYLTLFYSLCRFRTNPSRSVFVLTFSGLFPLYWSRLPPLDDSCGLWKKGWQGKGGSIPKVSVSLSTTVVISERWLTVSVDVHWVLTVHLRSVYARFTLPMTKRGRFRVFFPIDTPGPPSRRPQCFRRHSWSSSKLDRSYLIPRY